MRRFHRVKIHRPIFSERSSRLGKYKDKVLNYKDGIIGRLYHDLKWIYGFFREFIGRILAYIGVELVHIVIEFIITYKIGSIVDFAVEKNVTKVAIMGVIYVGLFVLNAVISIISNRFAAWNYNSMQTHLVKKLYYKIVKADWQELTKYHSGDLITRLTNDAKVISGNANGFLTTIITNALMIIGCTVVILVNDASMILVVLIVAPIILFSSKIFMNKIYECQSEIKIIESKENSYHKESFHNIQAVKAFGLADEFYRRIELLEKERFSADMKSNKFSLMSWVVTYLGGIFSAIICIAWAFYRVNTGAMTLGALTVVIMMAYRIAMAGKGLLNLIPVSLQLAVSTERVKEILSIPNEEEIDSPEFHELAAAGASNGISVKVQDMSFAYKASRLIFDKVSLEANPGEIIALVGPSGEGKTTMLRILLGILTAKSGQVYASVDSNGEIRRDLSPETRPLIAYVPQGNTMLSGTIAENM